MLSIFAFNIFGDYIVTSAAIAATTAIVVFVSIVVIVVFVVSVDFVTAHSSHICSVRT